MFHQLLSVILIMKILKSIAKSVLLPFRLTAAASETDAAIQKKIFGSSFKTSTY